MNISFNSCQYIQLTKPVGVLFRGQECVRIDDGHTWIVRGVDSEYYDVNDRESGLAKKLEDEYQNQLNVNMNKLRGNDETL